MSIGVADPFEQLRRADPLGSVDDLEIEERLERIRARLGNPVTSSSGLRRDTRRGLLIALAVLFGVVVTGTALALAVRVIDFGESAPADAPTQIAFGDLAKAAPEALDPRAIASEARTVRTITLAGAERSLSIAPTSQGGFCFRWSGLIMTCDAAGTSPLGVSLVSPRSGSTGVQLVLGYVDSDYATGVELQLAGGATTEPDVTWVSAPINAGFFAVTLPPDGGVVGNVVAVDAHGRVIASRPLNPGSHTGGRPTPPADAVLEDRDEIAAVQTKEGRATIASAPTRYGGSCDWLEFKDRFLAFTPCLPAGQAPPPFAFRFVPTTSTVLLVGRVSDGVHSIEIGYADGGRDDAPVKDGRVLFDVPSSHIKPGHEATRLTGYSSSGVPVASIPVAGLGGDRQPCLAPTIRSSDGAGPFCLSGS